MMGGFCTETDAEHRRKRTRRWVQLNAHAVEKVFKEGAKPWGKNYSVHSI